VVEPRPQLGVVPHEGQLAMRRTIEGMYARHIARTVAGGRVAVGSALIAAPGRVAPTWLGPMGRDEGAQFFCRLVGVRDVVMGAGVLAAMAGGGPVRGWLLAGAVADAADMAGTLAVADRLPRTSTAATLALTVGGVVLGLAAAAKLE
jgi:hypothetical protein